MTLLARLWSVVTTCMQLLTLSPFAEDGRPQHPLGGKMDMNKPEVSNFAGSPIFRPPSSNLDDFTCDYTKMVADGWRPCGNSGDRTCWLANTNGTEYNITTDYEGIPPTGIDRYYTLIVSDGWVNADGENFTEAKLINGTLPGPLLEACWGDTLHITVKNEMSMNGTSIHWHGIRQWRTMHMDGVNGITQCPIAPGDSFTYVWNATQYGSSWYHSHYSVQYADGVQAPITIHGPTSAPYNTSITPLIISDWGHNSAFLAQMPHHPIKDPSVLLNGRGNVNRFDNSVPTTLKPPDRFNMTFESATSSGPMKYLLRIINTSYGTTFNFSIDGHNLTVVEADFVPIQPYTTTSVLVAIGQRYHVIVDSLAITAGMPTDYWIRTWAVPGCGKAGDVNYEQSGILRYDPTSQADPTSSPWPNIHPTCSDESYENLVPMFNWTVGSAANGKDGEQFNVSNIPGSEGPFSLSFFSFERSNSTDVNPFQTDYGNPTFTNLANLQGNWPVGWVVVPENNYTDDDWVYLVLTGAPGAFNDIHPIHLHGHDFAILAQSENTSFTPDTPLKFDNPPRRDVVLLNSQGFVVIAFKSDNPGVWLIHCHIAFHASSGLALQIMERQGDANNIWPPGNSNALNEAYRVCANWNTWAYSCQNFWPGPSDSGDYPSCDSATELQNDSGV